MPGAETPTPTAPREAQKDRTSPPLGADWGGMEQHLVAPLHPVLDNGREGTTRAMSEGRSRALFRRES